MKRLLLATLVATAVGVALFILSGHVRTYTVEKLFTLEVDRVHRGNLLHSVNGRFFLLPARTYRGYEAPVLEAVHYDGASQASETELIIPVETSFVCKNEDGAFYQRQSGEYIYIDLTRNLRLPIEEEGQITLACEFVRSEPSVEGSCGTSSGVKFAQELARKDGVLVGCSYGNEGGAEIRLVSPEGEIRWRQVVDDGNGEWFEQVRAQHIHYLFLQNAYAFQARYSKYGKENKYGQFTVEGWSEPLIRLREGPWYKVDPVSGLGPKFEIYKAGEPTILKRAGKGPGSGLWIIWKTRAERIGEMTVDYDVPSPAWIEKDGCGLVFLRSRNTGRSEKLPNGGWKTPTKEEAIEVRWCDG